MRTATTEKSRRIVVDVSSDNLSASINLRSSLRASQVTQDEIIQTLKVEGIAISGSVRERVSEFVERISDGKPLAEPFLVAEGRPAQDACNESLIWDDRFQQEMDAWLEDAPGEFYTFNSIITVEKGDLIGTLCSSTHARDGVNVKGKTLRGLGRPRSLTLDATVERSAEDKSQVYAKASGVVTEEKGVLRVEDALVIDGDASAEFGHVDSPLYVQIKGGIQENLEVRSAKSITVGNSVSRANASAAGSIVVRRGIIGQGTELIESGQDIIAKFASDTKLVAGGDMRIAKQLMRCEAFVGGRLLAETANVIGGSLYASKGGIVRNLGNEADLPTNIVVGICSESLQGIFVIDRRTAELRELVDKLQEIITPILDGSMDSTTEQTRRARQLSRTCRDASTRIEKDLKRREKLVHSLLTTEPVRLRVGGVVHGRVTLRIGDRVTYFHKKFQGPVTIEKQKVKNVTEVMAISQPSGATQVLKSEKRPVEALFESPEEER